MQRLAGIIFKALFTTLLLLYASSSMAQRFFNLTADDVKIDSIMPVVTYVMPLADNYTDSVYTAEVKYAEYMEMKPADIEAYEKYCDTPLPAYPSVSQTVVTTRKKSRMVFGVSPFVMKDGKPQVLVSYMLDIKSAPASRSKSAGRSADSAGRYAEHSVLASGKWAKIQVSETGVCQLTESVIRQAGFRNLNKVKIYGYGGNMVPEVLTDEYLRKTDDLKEVATATINNRRLFFAKGPVHWDSAKSDVRIRNPYSTHGCYFITETDDEPLTMSEEELKNMILADSNTYHSLHEVDNYSWYEGGRNLVEAAQITEKKSYTLKSPKGATTQGRMTVCLSAGVDASYSISLNGKRQLSGTISINSYDKAAFSTRSFNVTNLQEENTVEIQVSSGGPIRLDYISIMSSDNVELPDLATAAFPAAEYVYNITNQDHHADEAVDLTIIIPTSQILLEQAKRLKEHHENHDGMTVRIVPADELYNEFSSGTPDVSAYRRYMKMMYDRAQTEAEMPKYLLLFGDCVWDNRLLTSECRTLNADNLLLCFESERTANTVHSYVSDDFIVLLDDNEALYSSESKFVGTPDVGVGRFPTTTEATAKIMVDKTIAYALNKNVGPWQNTIMFMGDDGNNNLHMTDVNTVAENVIRDRPGYYIRKIMWDAYKRVESSTGNRYPEVEDAIKAQQQAGALIMDYAGHGAANSISHEYVLRISDFNNFTNSNLPLWVTASCDIGPFDGTENTIGETVLTNQKGGGIGFFGTTRTVYANYNKYINDKFIEAVLGTTNGKRNTLGDAVRIAKDSVVIHKYDETVNKIQYSLLGDPALTLNTPRYSCVVDSINGVPVDGGVVPVIRANSKVRVSGYVANNGALMSEMNGNVSILVRDNIELINCLQNDKIETLDKFSFKDRRKVLFSGIDNVKDGKFNIVFTVPRDINYSNENGLITLFAYNEDATITAHGETNKFLVGGSETLPNDSIGPSIYCYLNSSSFVNGGDVNATPYFRAEIKDKDGINVSGSGIGHDLQLVIDNKAGMTYNLNDNFQYDFGSYTSGSTFFNIPTLSEGPHTLRFRAWDILNNPSTTTLSFNVISSQKPTIVDVNATKNPAKNATTFIATHDRPGSEVNMKVEIFDMSGRLLHTMSQTTTTSSATSVMDWDLTTSNGNRLQTGIYLYRVNVSGANTSIASKAKKLIIIND